ncbi:MAG: RNA polymerase-binding protein DksA [Proteobacteria bacterium]|nr:RNA polymerase-binding protein DksA [Pseudomonadota bacterium]
MDEEKLAYFRSLLNQWMEDISEGAKDTVVEMTDEDDTFPDPTDRATLESDRNFVLRMRDRERKLRPKIMKALERLDNGSFGICEACGEEISIDRLKVRPVTTLCIECKKQQEQQEKAHKG